MLLHSLPKLLPQVVLEGLDFVLCIMHAVLSVSEHLFVVAILYHVKCHTVPTLLHKGSKYLPDIDFDIIYSFFPRVGALV